MSLPALVDGERRQTTIKGPSSSSGNRPWIPQFYEYKSNRGTHDDGHRDYSWQTSPCHRSQDFFDEREQHHAPVGFNIPAPRSPHSSFPIFDEHHPDAYYATPGHPSSYHPDHATEYPYYDPHYPDSPILQPHFTEPVYFDEPLHHSPQHVSSPIDKPVQPNSPVTSNSSSHSPSFSYSEPFRHDHADDRRYFDARSSPSPFNVPIPIPPSPRARRRDSDPASYGKPPSPTTPTSGRSVRFNDDPVEPFPSPRRKGWWNRKGEQLWDNDGSYAAARENDMYPPDLRGYPEPGEGWMNEEGVMIDMKRRLMRKRLRSALKKTSL
ncbi:hypothetical protein BU17DRAFT_88513 [Hysterangium stoloniferum]|nr:hypothetical protein BU17DRAFT_88513 [Hysterangium stoloniferum]